MFSDMLTECSLSHDKVLKMDKTSQHMVFQWRCLLSEPKTHR